MVVTRPNQVVFLGKLNLGGCLLMICVLLELVCQEVTAVCCFLVLQVQGLDIGSGGCSLFEIHIFYTATLWSKLLLGMINLVVDDKPQRLSILVFGIRGLALQAKHMYLVFISSFIEAELRCNYYSFYWNLGNIYIAC